MIERYPELVRKPESAELFFNEFKGKLPEKSLLAGFNFATQCDNFHYDFNRYLLTEGKSLYRVMNHIKVYFDQNQSHQRRLVLFSLFIREYMDATGKLLLSREYYELMKKFDEAQEKINKMVHLLMADYKE